MEKLRSTKLDWLPRNMHRNKVAKEYAEEQGIDYEEVYALVAQMDYVRMILAFTA